MSQTLRHLKAIARHLGIGVKQLRDSRMAFVDEHACLHLKPEVLCEKDLIGWRHVPKTTYT